MTEDDKKEIKTITGQVKWFDPTKGFGFVVSDDGGPDILLHANVLRNFGQSSVADQAGIQIVVQETDRGMQTTEILRIDPPLPDGDQSLDEFDLQEELDVEDLEPARVKWFDKSKGFGFANVYGSADDVFIHVEVLRRSGLADLQPGEAICIRVNDGERGSMATHVLPWDASFEERE